MFKLTFDDGSSFQPTKIIGVGLNYAAHIDEMKNITSYETFLVRIHLLLFFYRLSVMV